MGMFSYAQRKHMAKKEFALPGKKTAENPAGKGGYPIPDKAHARNALARVAQHGTSAQKAQVRAKVHAKFPGIGRHSDAGREHENAAEEGNR